MDSKFFSNNRKSLAKRLGSGLVIVAGNLLMQRSGDTTFSFRQDSSAWYLSGIEVPGLIVCIDIDNGEEFAIVPMPEGVKAIFDGEVDANELASISGIKKIYNETEGWATIRSKKPKSIHACMPAPARYEDIATNPHRASVLRRLKRTFKGVDIVDVRMHIATLRSIKQPAEIAAIEAAANITYESLGNVIADIDSYATEAAIEGALTAQFRARGASGHAYTPIVAGGPASCTLHYVKNNQKIARKQPLLFDVGAEYNNYAADISRTCIVGPASARQMAVIDAVAWAQNEVVQAIKPGMTFKELSDISVQAVGRQLVRLGLIKDAQDNESVRTYFPHSVSHFLGLDVHDVGDYRGPLQEGMVITVEPGIYIPEEALGVRIEDDFLITKNGAKVLGAALPAVL